LAYRPHHSTETALNCVLNDLFCNIDAGHLTLLISLDISASFDLVSHNVLIRRLEESFGIIGCALDTIKSFLSPRSMSISVNSCTSQSVPCLTGVPQGSVLGPLLFTTYVSAVANIIMKFGFCFHYYADDLLIYCKLDHTDPLSTIPAIESCLHALHSWFICNYMVINPSKTECLLVGTSRSVSKFRNKISLSFADPILRRLDTMKYLGITLDPTLTFDNHCALVHLIFV
jgi:hypothetical protein